jgi:hypothetical protein
MIEWVAGQLRMIRRPVVIPMAAGLLSLALAARCGTSSLSTDPTGQQTTGTTSQPSDADLAYDRAALMAAMAHYINYGADGEPLSYTFALLLAFQNHIGATFAFDVWVNGQFVERRTVLPNTQEVVAITNTRVRQTETATGVTSEDIPLLGRPTPFVVRLTNFVCDDDHIVQDMNMILAPVNAFTTNWRPITLDIPPVILGPHYVCPAVFAFVVEKTRIQVIEVDREDMPDEPDEDESLEPAEADWPPLCTLIYLAAEEAVLTTLGLDPLLSNAGCP